MDIRYKDGTPFSSLTLNPVQSASLVLLNSIFEARDTNDSIYWIGGKEKEDGEYENFIPACHMFEYKPDQMRYFAHAGLRMPMRIGKSTIIPMIAQTYMQYATESLKRLSIARPESKCPPPLIYILSMSLPDVDMGSDVVRVFETMYDMNRAIRGHRRPTCIIVDEGVGFEKSVDLSFAVLDATPISWVITLAC